MNARNPTVYATFTVGSIYSGPLTFELVYDGTEDKVITLGEGLKLTELKEARNARVQSQREILLVGSAEQPSRLKAAVAGPVNADYGSPGVTDSGRFAYPMITGRANVDLMIPANTRARVAMVFPASTHFLPDKSQVQVRGATQPLAAAYLSYPDVVQSCDTTVEPQADPSRVEFDMEYRESAVAIAVTLVAPFLVNLLVPLLCLAGEARVVRIPVALAIVPLYFSLWNWSNLLRAAPSAVNILSTLMAVLVAYNVAFAVLWMAKASGYLQGLLAVAYLLTFAAVLDSVWQFTRRHFEAKYTQLGMLQALGRQLRIRRRPPQ